MLHWFVYIEDFNRREIGRMDLFDGSYLREECKKALLEADGDKERFGERVRSAIMYRYWSRCEYEIILSGWPPDKTRKFREEKIDVYDQVMLNWPVFLDYVWNHREEL